MVTQIKAEVIADSICGGSRITTFKLTFPRFILAELNTHRVFSKNSASSRAIPFNKMVESVNQDPFIPIAWGKHHTGMQGTEYITDQAEQEQAQIIWLRARDNAVAQATLLFNQGVTKQICNRLLEPYMWHTILLTATDFDNFFKLRCPAYETPGLVGHAKSKREWQERMQLSSALQKANWPQTTTDWLKYNSGQAEIHMMALAEAMYDAYQEHIPKELIPGEWHIPFGDQISNDAIDQEFLKPYGFDYNPGRILGFKREIAVARCARISYTLVGDPTKTQNFEADLKLAKTLKESGHMSPFEHVAQAMDDPTAKCRNFTGWMQLRHLIEKE